jgi:hypothetical protein
VQARDLLVPDEGDVGLRVAADRVVVALGEGDDPLALVTVAE